MSADVRILGLRARAGGAAAIAAMGYAAVPFGADAQESPLNWSLSYQSDVVAASGDGVNRHGRWLDSLHATLDFDAANWIRGGAFHIDLNNTAGAAPNDDAATLQGVDNIEVGGQRLRVYELWYEQSGFDGHAALRAGLQEVNADFYATDASGLLMNPSFGLGPEFSSTGSNGPSTYPSTSLAVRGRVVVGPSVDLRLAVFNARASSLGDPGGVNLDYPEGAITIGEVTWNGWGSLSLGAWRYTRRRDDIREVDGLGAPLRRHAQGFYGLAQARLWGGENDVRSAVAFVRAGFSEGRTTPFRSSWQSGVLLEHVFAGRPDSVLSAGIASAALSSGFRANLEELGARTSTRETIFELAYSDRMSPWVSIQPDIQFVSNAGGDRDREAFIAGIRISVDFSSDPN
ncbi:MAG: carbohydrate porin [Proteobacteria bacterium]|nr:carbohydrate porin [Pseudomonadota bacterium]